MEIPVFFAEYTEEGVMATDGVFSAISPRPGPRHTDLRKAVSDSNRENQRSPAVIVDCNSFEDRTFSEKVMKHMRLPQTEMWFMTYIETVEDVFDAFNRDATYVLAPYHFIESDAELRDICDVSDSFIPVIFVHRGKAVLPGGRKADVLSVLEKLVSIGFYRNCVLDTEGGLDGYTWSVIREDYPSTVPIVDSPGHAEGFETYAVPYML